MKLSHLLLAAGLVVGISLSAPQASAATVDFTGNFVDMTPTPLEIGQSGVITSSGFGFGNTVFGLIAGSLPSNSMITFTYNFAGTVGAALLNTTSGYSYVDGGSTYGGYSFASNGTEMSIGSVNGTPSTALAVSSAQIDTSNSASIVIKNFSAGALAYANSFIGAVLGSKNFTVAYNVSAVPVPAALPLFGLGLGAIAMMRARARKKEKLAA